MQTHSKAIGNESELINTWRSSCSENEKIKLLECFKAKNIKINDKESTDEEGQ